MLGLLPALLVVELLEVDILSDIAIIVVIVVDIIGVGIDTAAVKMIYSETSEV